MIIENHKLQGVPFIQAGTIRARIVPEIIVMHYTAGQNARGPIALFKSKGAPVSAHLVIDQDGAITQMVEFNIRAAHAGASVWRGKSGCNAFSIGIELVNPGPLVRGPNGLVDTTASAAWHGGVYHGRHKNGGPYDQWAAYPEAQIAAAKAAVDAICAAYEIRDIVGHDEIAPKRKIDPGPAFPWERFRSVEVES